eukprot:Gregarina_sp_Poly_1__5516@NODE_290_length_9967_cov_88_266061_g251_i0_p2_GENE_NODE_290_length_9967_cov_88_266061_g251_i0NODE_290_length_9967_cov_88_266061_g251_i0_p2_ORF_typecomplete_len733_score90_96DTC/PF18102_1/1_8e24zfRING_2/PF13639_6/5_8e03zfRING_2/PF13639_6/4_8e08zfC3HC4/PF00097_25/1_5e07zfRING_UBOX/PF13445_6/4_7e03zfRING_UBOX/PF13445_6/1_4e05zfRING_11/PF17123_5/1_4e05zfC3HC4_2/PF13923_6/3_1e03zfC3HC4_2/PF13923_6/5_7e06zfrbx1/PF12678_7/5_7e05zfRING_5/PF14634_6/5_3e03zfRING_5/PF14634_6/3e05z
MDIDMGLVGLFQMYLSNGHAPRFIHPALCRLLMVDYLRHKSGLQHRDNRRGLQIVPEWNYKFGLYRYRLQPRHPRSAIIESLDSQCSLVDQQNIVSLRKRPMRLVPFCNELLANSTDSYAEAACPLQHSAQEEHYLYSYLWLFHARDGLFERYEHEAEKELEGSFRIHLHALAKANTQFPQTNDLAAEGDLDDLQALASGRSNSQNTRRGLRRSSCTAVVTNRVLDSEVCYESFRSKVAAYASSWDICRIGICIHKVTDPATGDKRWRIKQSLVIGREMILKYGLGVDPATTNNRALRAQRRHDDGDQPFEVSFHELSFAFRLRPSEEGLLGNGEIEYKPRRGTAHHLPRVFKKLLVRNGVPSDEISRPCKRRKTSSESVEPQVVLSSSEESATTGTESQPVYNPTDVCSICLDTLANQNGNPVKLPNCIHWYHEECIIEYVEKGGLRRGAIQCPLCSTIQLAILGPSPKGKMTWQLYAPGDRPIAGFESDGSIEITYSMPSGRQILDIHPWPGREYVGSVRVAWLPITQDGCESLLLLSKAFLAGQIFMLEEENGDAVIKWNRIPHKVNRFGGGSHGFPDASYFRGLQSSCLRFGVRLDEAEIAQAKQAFKYFNDLFNKAGTTLPQPSFNTMTQRHVAKSVLNQMLRNMRPDLDLSSSEIQMFSDDEPTPLDHEEEEDEAEQSNEESSSSGGGSSELNDEMPGDSDPGEEETDSEFSGSSSA